MMDTNNTAELVITHTDLDGATSYCALCWSIGKRLPVKPLTNTDFLSFWRNSVLKNIDKFKTIYVCDISPDTNTMLFDFPNVVIIDHHPETLNTAKDYKKATVIANNSKSTSQLIYKHYLPEITKEQKLLILLASDYDSYEMKIPTSRLLNYLFWSYQGDRVAKFYDEFKSGFKGFNKFQNNIISFYIKRLKEITDNIQIYTGQLPFNNQVYTIASAISDFAINDIAEFVIDTAKSDIAAIINLKSNKISLRKHKSCDCDLGELAKLYSGGGHKDSAGGILNDAFINLTKSLALYEFRQSTSGRNGPSF